MQHILPHQTRVAVPYGNSVLNLELPANTIALGPDDPEHTCAPEKFRADLREHLGATGPDLTSPILIVTDKTRLCGYPEYLPMLTAEIQEARGDNSPFPVIIAYGTHPRQSDEECMATYGPLYRKWIFRHHDCTDQTLFTEVGKTSRNTPIRLRNDLLGASAIITMGPICHHYFAGYGGGRKLIFPGCGEREAIYHNHSLYLDQETQTLAHGCQPGSLEENPLAADLFEYEQRLPAHLSIHGIQDSHGRICDFIIGSGREVYLAACRRHGAHFEIDGGQFDTVVASAGGYPKDINFIQVHKAIHNSSGFVKDGGRLILFAECIDQVGSQTLLPWFGQGSFSNAFQQLSKKYEGNGGTALAMMSKTNRISVCMVTALEQQVCRQLGVEKWQAQEVNYYLRNAPSRIAWIANGSLLVARKNLIKLRDFNH